MDILFAVTGLVLLLLSGDVLVRGAVNLGLRLGIPALIVSLTISCWFWVYRRCLPGSTRPNAIAGKPTVS